MNGAVRTDHGGVRVTVATAPPFLGPELIPLLSGPFRSELKTVLIEKKASGLGTTCGSLGRQLPQNRLMHRRAVSLDLDTFASQPLHERTPDHLGTRGQVFFLPPLFVYGLDHLAPEAKVDSLRIDARSTPLVFFFHGAI